MKELSLSGSDALFKNIKYTITRDGRLGIGMFDYYKDNYLDATITNPTSHLMVNGSISLPGITYDSGTAITTTLTNGHYTVVFKGTDKTAKVKLPTPSADVLHRVYIITNHKKPEAQLISSGSLTSGRSYTVVTQGTSSPDFSNITVSGGNVPTNPTVGYTFIATNTATPTSYGGTILRDNTDSSDLATSPYTLTSGTLVSGNSYTIMEYKSSDNFTNLSATSNATGVTFTASGTTPTTWSNGSILRDNTKANYIIVYYEDGATEETVVTVDPVLYLSKAISKVSDIPVNSIAVQCQRVSRVASSTPEYDWKLINVSHYPVYDSTSTTIAQAPPPAPIVVTYGGILYANLYSVSGRTTSAITTAVNFRTAISITVDGSAGSYVSGSNFQIAKRWTSGQTVTISINNSALPIGYTYTGAIISGVSGTTFVTPDLTNTNTNSSFTVNLTNATVNPTPATSNTTATYVQLNFFYTAPVTFTTQTTTTSTPTITQSCPTPDMLIMVSPNTWRRAGSLEVGDLVYTKHETSGEWGYYELTHAEAVLQPIVKVKVGDKLIKVSESHQFLTAAGVYTKVLDLSPGDMLETLDGMTEIESIESIGESEVISFEVDSAHTYIVEGVLSHNKTIGTSGGFTNA